MSTFAPEPLLVYLSVHAVKHCWSKLSWVADIAWLIEHHRDFDWDYLLTLALEQGCSRTVRLALALARDWLGASLPGEASRAIDSDCKVPALARRVAYWWTLPEEKAPGPENNRWERTRFFFEVQDDWKGRIRYIARLLFVPNLHDWKFIRLPVRWRASYLVLRPLRFLLCLLSLPKRQS